MDQFSLAKDFPAAEAEWIALAEKALAGAPYETLNTTLYEGIITPPLYVPGQGPSIFVDRGAAGWAVVQDVFLDGSATAETFGGARQGGADAFWLRFADPELTASRLATSLGGISGCKFYLDGGLTPENAAMFLAAAKGNGVELSGSAGFDPLSDIAASGETTADRAAFSADLIDAAAALKAHPGFIPFMAKDEAWHGAGGSAVHELAFTLAAGVSYWRTLAEAGWELDAAASAVSFSLTASADIFLSIAKFRAFRLLWQRALHEALSDASRIAPFVMAQTSSRMMTLYDPHTNLLRATAAAFAAAVGGANAIRVAAFDVASGSRSALAQRLARNTSHILRHEAHLATVSDAAHGSPYVESLTGDLAERSWALFREVEAKGGLAQTLESGFVQASLGITHQERDRAIARRRDKITGVSIFPNLSESMPPLPLPSAGEDTAAPGFDAIELPQPEGGQRFAAFITAAQSGRTLAELRVAGGRVREKISAPLTARRVSEHYESLRLQSDIALQRLGSRPPVFLGMLGPAHKYRARLAFVQAFFAAGGIEVISSADGYETLDDLSAAFRRSPTPVACLCSTDGGYAAFTTAAAELKRAGATFVYAAAPPALLKNLDPNHSRSIDRLIFEGCDAVAVLTEAQAVLRVEDLSLNAEADE